MALTFKCINLLKSLNNYKWCDVDARVHEWYITATTDNNNN